MQNLFSVSFRHINKLNHIEQSIFSSSPQYAEMPLDLRPQPPQALRLPSDPSSTSMRIPTGFITHKQAFGESSLASNLPIWNDAGRLSQDLSDETLSIIRRRPYAKDLSFDEIQAQLNLMTARIKSSPIQIGFSCGANYFDEQGTFWPAGRYYNAPLWNKLNGYRTPPFKPMESKALTPEQRPIYGAVNLSLRGHVGWGDSFFVLKPSVISKVQLRSRDTGDTDGIGLFAQVGTYDHMAPIFQDWAKIHYLDKLWVTLAAAERLSFTPQHQLPLETAIYTETGFIDADEVAMIVICIKDLKNLQANRVAIEARCAELKIPVIFQHEEAGKIKFEEIGEYQAIVQHYIDYFNCNG